MIGLFIGFVLGSKMQESYAWLPDRATMGTEEHPGTRPVWVLRDALQLTIQMVSEINFYEFLSFN